MNLVQSAGRTSPCESRELGQAQESLQRETQRMRSCFCSPHRGQRVISSGPFTPPDLRIEERFSLQGRRHRASIKEPPRPSANTTACRTEAKTIAFEPAVAARGPRSGVASVSAGTAPGGVPLTPEVKWWCGQRCYTLGMSLRVAGKRCAATAPHPRQSVRSLDAPSGLSISNHVTLTRHNQKKNHASDRTKIPKLR